MNIFEERGITADVAAGRPYVRYERCALDALLDLSPAFRNAPAKVKWRTKDHGGWVIMKTPVPGSRAPIIRSSARMSRSSRSTRSTGHADLLPTSMAEHIAGSNHIGLAIPEADEDHEHIKEAKYLLWPKPRMEKVTTTTRTRMTAPEFATSAPTMTTPEPQERTTTSSRSGTRSSHRRIGWTCIPDRRHSYKSAPRIFFVIEGALKADARCTSPRLTSQARPAAGRRERRDDRGVSCCA